MKICSNFCGVFFGKQEESTSKKCTKSIATIVALAAIAAIVVGALAIAGIIALSNPVSIGLLAGGSAAFALTIIALAIANNRSNPKLGVPN